MKIVVWYDFHTVRWEVQNSSGESLAAGHDDNQFEAFRQADEALAEIAVVAMDNATERALGL